MLDAAIKALTQLFSRPFRTVLLKSAGLAVALLALLMIALYWFSAWLAAFGGAWAEGAIGSFVHGPLIVLGWVLAFALGFGLFAGAIFLMPAVSSFTASFFVDEISARVEREHYPADPPGVALSLPHAMVEGLKAAALGIVVYLCAAPFLLFAGFGAVIFFLAIAYVLGRQYFELVAMRFLPATQAKALRRIHRTRAFVGGLFIAAFVSIPILNLATPLFGTALMVHVYKRLAGAVPHGGR